MSSYDDMPIRAQIIQEEPAPSYPFTNPDTLAQIIGRTDVIDNMIDSLKGIRRDGRSRKIVFQSKYPLLNEMGIDSMASILNSVLSANTILSKFNDDDISNLTGILAEAVIEDLEMNYRRYEIHDISHMNKIASVVITSIYCSIKSAMNGYTGNLISPMYRRMENIRPEKERQGFMPSFGGGR